MPETYNLRITILAIPATLERTFFAIKRIKNFTKFTHGKETLTGSFLIIIKNNYFKNLDVIPNVNLQKT